MVVTINHPSHNFSCMPETHCWYNHTPHKYSYSSSIFAISEAIMKNMDNCWSHQTSKNWWQGQNQMDYNKTDIHVHILWTLLCICLNIASLDHGHVTVHHFTIVIIVSTREIVIIIKSRGVFCGHEQVVIECRVINPHFTVSFATQRNIFCFRGAHSLSTTSCWC